MDFLEPSKDRIPYGMLLLLANFFDLVSFLHLHLLLVLLLHYMYLGHIHTYRRHSLSLSHTQENWYLFRFSVKLENWATYLQGLSKKKKSLCVLTVTVSLFLGDQVVDTWILYGQAARNTMGACPFQRKFYLSTPDCPVCPSYLATLRWRLEISPQTVFTAKEISPQTGLTSFRTNPQSREKTKGRFNLKKND